ncbi:uncharacterized protein A4U43_C01F80 [Asparagus officinalis]|uniref:Uncharacterized protein n=1 Tax=Asparagus officinalis TaxID=4686 RepID=A0A5P1FN31_ASPOF|nr:uncharacterized protein A4U43_C01F80 [Asparagus officinalis]
MFDKLDELLTQSQLYSEILLERIGWHRCNTARSKQKLKKKKVVRNKKMLLKGRRVGRGRLLARSASRFKAQHLCFLGSYTAKNKDVSNSKDAILELCEADSYFISINNIH